MENKITTTLQTSARNGCEPSSPVTYNPGEPITPAMLTPKAISDATTAVKTAQHSVDLTRGRHPQGYLPTIGEIRRNMGEQSAADVIRLQLAWLNTQINATRPLTSVQIDIMAPFILQHMMEASISYNLADIKIVFQRAAAGVYGKLYGGIGVQDVCQWLDAYEQEKIDAIDRWEGQHRDGDPYERRSLDASVEQDINHAAQVWYQQMKLNQQKSQENEL